LHIDPAKLIDAIADCMIENMQELTELDAAIGDADHGLNMRKGGEALRAEMAAFKAASLPQALQLAGNILATTVGGAAGPLYGSLLMTMGKSIGPDPDLGEVGRALAAGVEAMERLGKVEAGQKTMLDVWKPVSRLVAREGATVQNVRALAREAAVATIPMEAQRGRASYLGERSRGHMDPGARSSELLILAVTGALEFEP
jgi:phosphoenolpyruvate---glycerone phosphotransferase subunit DhaL